MNDMLKKALSDYHEPSEALNQASEVMKSDMSPQDKETELELLRQSAPEHEQNQFKDFFSTLAREFIDGR